MGLRHDGRELRVDTGSRLWKLWGFWDLDVELLEGLNSYPTRVYEYLVLLGSASLGGSKLGLMVFCSWWGVGVCSRIEVEWDLLCWCSKSLVVLLFVVNWFLFGYIWGKLKMLEASLAAEVDALIR
ncbi:hypothetical protein Droror1_Dr00025618 [Drosera rotundifolia]